ncbi:MAG: hypothetical protein CSA39_01975 [Flavobacteriales bacterium]|nr:MAG: hypothetical protein CSA39_01975 [Flavobacteriales bacterium]
MPLKQPVFLTKLLHSEHWPAYLYYFPLIPYYIFSALQLRNLTFYLAANPSIKYSGNGSESKYKTLQLIPKKHIPKTILAPKNSAFSEIIKELEQAGITFPIIAKPDIGFRGLLVRKIHNKQKLQEFLKKNNINLILQEYIDYPNECGIFFVKIPGEPTGKITSITLKKFISVTGNGTDNLKDLILNHQRACIYKKIFFKLHTDNLNKIIKKGQMIKLTDIGNHSKGTTFINGNHLIEDKLTRTFNAIAKEIPQWHYGRIDLKYHSWEALQDGKDFKIIELNGIIAEPTHIYDTKKGSYFASLKSILTHWRWLKKIAVKNHKINKTNYPKTKPYIADMLALRKYSKNLVRLHHNE